MQPKLNPVFARFQFNNETHGDGTIGKFVTRLHLRARDCKFGGKEDELIRCQLVFGTNCCKVRKKLINEGEALTLDKVVQMVQNLEYCKQQMVSMSLKDQR